jgi:two-component system chemotaxis response regulator CheB
LSQLPAGFPACVVVVQHLDPKHPSLLVQILAQHTPLHVKQAVDNESLQAAVVYVAPPDWHVLFATTRTLSLTQTELVNYLRPAADLLFTSLARAYGARAIAVVLTGTGSDGSRGVREVRRMGGKVIAQNQQSSEFYGMPAAAISTGCVDYVLALDDIAPALVNLVSRGVIQ